MFIRVCTPTFTFYDETTINCYCSNNSNRAQIGLIHQDMWVSRFHIIGRVNLAVLSANFAKSTVAFDFTLIRHEIYAKR